MVLYESALLHLHLDVYEMNGKSGAFDMGSEVRGEPKQRRISMSKKNISLLVSAAGWISGLVEKLVSALRERGITDEEIHALVTETGKELIGKIADVIAEFVKQTKKVVYTILVDYAVSVEELLKLGKYDWSNSDITSEHFPTKRTGGKVETKVELVHFGRNISSDEALKELDKMGYRPAEAHELLAFGAKYPDVQREFPIVALGSVWRSSLGCRSVVCLYENTAERDAALCWLEGDWGDGWRFAAVRK